MSISLLPVVSEIIEITIHIQTQEYLYKNGLSYKYQSGFCSVFSMDSCLAQSTDFILRRMKKGFHTVMILVDLQKKFDTLDHTAFLQKMECIGFKESIIKRFQSYLSNRKFFVTADVFSDAGLINCGVTQRSILGSLLFETGSYLYSGDTCIFY